MDANQILIYLQLENNRTTLNNDTSIDISKTMWETHMTS